MEAFGFLSLFLVIYFSHDSFAAQREFHSRVTCNENRMQVKLWGDAERLQSASITPKIDAVGFSDCPKPKVKEIDAVRAFFFDFDLTKFEHCGFTRLRWLDSGVVKFQNFLYVNVSDGQGKARIEPPIKISCQYAGDNNNTERVKRQEPWDGFQEIDPTEHKKIDSHAPEPQLVMQIYQHDLALPVGGSVPIGSDLQLVIEMDPESSQIYGMEARRLTVEGENPDVDGEAESLIENGCPVNIRVFPGMRLKRGSDGRQLLESDFQAFKYPTSMLIRFVGVVNICIDQCNSNNACSFTAGQSARQKRGIREQAQVVEVTTTAAINVYDGNDNGNTGRQIAVAAANALNSNISLVFGLIPLFTLFWN